MYPQANWQYLNQYFVYDHQYNYPYMLKRDNQPFFMDNRQGRALWWNSEIRTLSSATENIGEIKMSAADILRKKGFSDVVHNRQEVAGNKGGCRVSIAHFHRTGREFWEVVMCTCETAEQARGMVNDIVTTLRRLKFL